MSERESPQKYPAYINIMDNLAKQKKYCYKQVSPKPATTEPMRLILLILVFVSSLLLAGTTASAVFSTKKKDILKLIGTTYAPIGKFVWIELNGEDYGWTRKGSIVGKYRIVMVEMGQVIVESVRKTLFLVILEGTQFEVKQ